MATKQLNVRLSDPGWDKLDELARLYGSQTRVIEVAIDRMYHSEIEEANEMNERRWDRMARELDEVVAEAKTVEDVTEALFELGWSKDDIDAALDDPNFPDLPTR